MCLQAAPLQGSEAVRDKGELAGAIAAWSRVSVSGFDAMFLFGMTHLFPVRKLTRL